jgi:alpha-galactosidase
MTSIDVVSNLDRFAGPGGWNDPDMLVIGLNNTGFIKGGGCTDIEYRTQMSMWCMLAAPLMMGCDVRKMDETTKSILMNQDIIDIDQDVLGKQGFRVYRKDGIEAFKKPLSGDRVAIALLNRNSMDKKVTASYEQLELEPDVDYSFFDVWEHTTVDQPGGMITEDLKQHECKVFVLSSPGQ